MKHSQTPYQRGFTHTNSKKSLGGFTHTNSKKSLGGFTHTNSTKSLGGFTILELMIATMVFSVILLLVTTGIIQIGKTYYKGALQARTQDTARNIIDEVSRGIQFSGVDPVPTTPILPTTTYPAVDGQYWFCVNGINYSYNLDKQLGSTGVNEALISYDFPCASFIPSAAVAMLGHKELLGIGMRLTALNVENLNNNTYRITVEVASGEFDLFSDLYSNIDGTTVGSDGLYDSCKSGAGSQFCAISRLTTTVQKRVE